MTKIDVKSPDIMNADDVNKAVAELIEAQKSGDKAREEKIEAFLDEQEKKSAKVARELADRQKFEDEMKDSISNINATLNRMPSTSADYKNAKVEMKHMESFIRKGKEYLLELKSTAPELKYLRTDDNVDGGYLVPIEYDNELIKKITEISNLRSLARIRTIGSNRLSAAVRNTLVSAYWVGEGETISKSNSKYGNETIQTQKMGVQVEITNEELADSAWNMDVEINQDVSEAFAKLEGAAFLTGTGVNRPEGIITNSDVGVVNSGIADALDFNLLNDLQGELKTGYNPAYGMNRKTISYIRKLTDAVGQPLWQAGNLQAGVPNMILGVPYYEMPDLADVAAGTKPIVFGDFRRGYTIVDRIGMRVIRDEFTLAGEDKVRFVFTKRVGGQVVLPEALKIGYVAV